MHRDRDFDTGQTLPVNEKALMQDLELNALLTAMAQGDEFLLQMAKQSVLSGLREDLETVLYRQAVLRDCLKNNSTVRRIYEVALETIESRRKYYYGVFGNFPSAILSGAVDLLQMFMVMLGRLRQVADEHAGEFESEGFTAFFSMLRTELTDEYIAAVQGFLGDLKFREGVLVSAELGEGNEGTRYVLRKSLAGKAGWFRRLVDRGPPSYTFHLHPRDDAGAQALSQLRTRGIHLVANALAQSADHVLSFFVMLRAELAFYVGCLNLHGRLARTGVPISFPVPATAGARRCSCAGLRDVGLALSLEAGVVGNNMRADGRNLVVITGANQGGKSTFLRGIGVAQLMMQCGMFVAAESFSADLCRGLFTHYKREEDAAMNSGKFDEELGRMNEIAKALTPYSMLLFNESFAATNEREGSEIARQIVDALLEAPAKVFFVTHMYELAHGLFVRKREDAVFLRAERQTDGRRTFKLLEGEPLQTSFGADLYEEMFGSAAESSRRMTSE
jgi:hypothetical protein